MKTKNDKHTEKKKPYIDYKTARVLAFMHEFIVDTNRERELIIKELERQITFIQMSINGLKAVSDSYDLDNCWADAMKYGCSDNIAMLRLSALRAGLTSTLFKKLNDKEFRNRFTGMFGTPVLEEEIKDNYDDIIYSKKDTA